MDSAAQKTKRIRKVRDETITARSDYLRTLSPKEYKLHLRKRKALNKKYAAGSKAALERGRKSMATMRENKHSKINDLTPRQTEMLRETFYDDAVQVGVNAMYHYLKKTYPDDRTPTQRNILGWLKEQTSYQVNLRPKKSLTIQSGNLKTTRPHQAGSVDLIQFGQTNASYIFHVVDNFSRKSYAKWMNSKDDKDVAKAFRQILKENKRTPDASGNPRPLFRTLSYDAGSEFRSKSFQGILTKAGIKGIPSIAGKPVKTIERHNQKLQNWLVKYTDEKGVSAQTGLPVILKLINDDIPTEATKKTPNEVMAMPKDEIVALAEKVREKALKRRDIKQGPDDVKVGDKVRIKRTNKYKTGIGKKNKYFTNNWSNEVYVIQRVVRPKDQSTKAITYRVKGQELNSKLIFTRHDIQVIPSTTPTTDETDALEALEKAADLEKAIALKANAPPKEKAEVIESDYKYKGGQRIGVLGKWFKNTDLEKVFTNKRKYYNGTITSSTTADRLNADKELVPVQEYRVVWDDNEKDAFYYARIDIDTPEGRGEIIKPLD